MIGGGGVMGPDEDMALESREVQGEVELVGGEVLDAAASVSLPHPGEEPAGEPVEEVLGVRALTASEPGADELDVTYDTLELPVPDDEEELEEREPNLDEGLDRTVLRQDLETRFEALDEERAALSALEPREVVAPADAFLCTRCRLWKSEVQLVDPERRICRDCA
jgi:hypothetical protein